jgi:hypothetical protein
MEKNKALIDLLTFARYNSNQNNSSFLNDKFITTIEMINLNNCINNFFEKVNTLNEYNKLDSEITYELSENINRIVNCLLNIVIQNQKISDDAYSIYEKFVGYLKGYGWDNEKFNNSIDLQILKEDMNNCIKSLK